MATLLSGWETVVVVASVMVANGAPVLVRGRGRPLDLGYHFIDGRRLLGDGKTFEGTLVALLAGIVVGVLFSMSLRSLNALGAVFVAVPSAVLGDIVAAFVKRRLDMPRGHPFRVVDQLDFYVACLLGLYAAGFIVEPLVALVFAPLIYVLHRATNIAAYRLGLKSVPW